MGSGRAYYPIARIFTQYDEIPKRLISTTVQQVARVRVYHKNTGYKITFAINLSLKQFLDISDKFNGYMLLPSILALDNGMLNNMVCCVEFAKLRRNNGYQCANLILFNATDSIKINQQY